MHFLPLLILCDFIERFSELIVEATEQHMQLAKGAA